MFLVSRQSMLVVSAVTLCAAGCSPRSHPAPVSQAPKVWPAPPETARIAFVQSIHRPADVGIKASAITRFGRWLTGSDKGNEELIKPFGVALDENDNLCLTDTGANVVCFCDRTTKRWRRWSGVGGTRFVSPVAVAKRQGVIFVADSALGAVVAFDETGRLRFQTTNHLQRPSGLAIVGEQLFVADALRHCVVALSLGGEYVTEFGRRGAGPGEFNFPTHIAADAQGELLVTDSMNSRVQIMDTQGHYKGQVGAIGDSPGQFSRPKGVAADSYGHIYAIDALFDNIQIFDRAGRLLLNVGEAGSRPGEFWLPNGLAISRSNEIFAADSYNRRIQVFKYVGPS